MQRRQFIFVLGKQGDEVPEMKEHSGLWFQFWMSRDDGVRKGICLLNVRVERGGRVNGFEGPPEESVVVREISDDRTVTGKVGMLEYVAVPAKV